MLPPESARIAQVIAAFSQRAMGAGFGLVITPMFEHLEVFQRVGASTDVVRKEMYVFEDRGGRSMALRPEGTAGVVRAYVQHRPTPPWKVFYVAPNFRYERPQKGRYRQHMQLGVEVLGVDDPAIDVEVISLAHDFFVSVGIPNAELRINSMGDPSTRPAYRAALQAYFRSCIENPSEALAELIESNPLRVLDTKDPALAAVVAHAPALADSLSSESAAHFASVRDGLDRLGIPYRLDPRLVRGFDYYTRTTFEFSSPSLDAAQDAIGGGGRYDGLAEEMGGPPTPGIGFGIGLERVMLASEPEATAPRLHAFIISALDDPWESSTLAATLRTAGIATDRAFGGRSVKAQWKLADRSGAEFAVMLGAQEQARGAVVVKHLATGEQREILTSELVAWILEHRKHTS